MPGLMTGLAVLIPALQRPHRAGPVTESVRATAPHARIVFVCDPGDQAEQDAARAAGADVLISPGSYARKINRAAAATSEPLLFLAADDLRFHAGWLEAAVAKLTGAVGVVGTNDLGNRRVIRGEHATHSLVTRDYARRGTIDDPHRLLHEGYRHNFVDDEFVATAKRRGCFAHAPDSIVEHLHPLWGKAPHDPVYEIGDAAFRQDRRTYRRRSSLWT